MHSSVVLRDEGAWKEGKGGNDSPDEIMTQLCFKLNPKEHIGYFWTFATSAQSQYYRSVPAV
jgi:hypothetical protein